MNPQNSTTFKQILRANRTGRDPDCDLLDAIMTFCGSFYENHPLLSISTLQELAAIQFGHFSRVHELAKPLYVNMIEDWLNALQEPSWQKELFINLAWDAVGRFIDICRFESDASSRKETAKKRDLSMCKGWAQLIGTQRNLSAYRFVSRIFERDVPASDNVPCKSLSQLDDAGDPDVVHAFVFGNFSYLKSPNCTSHYPVTVFIRKEEAISFLSRAKDYKSFLEQLKEPMGLTVEPKTGIAYLVDTRDCKIVGFISGSSMTIQ